MGIADWIKKKLSKSPPPTKSGAGEISNPARRNFLHDREKQEKEYQNREQLPDWDIVGETKGEKTDREAEETRKAEEVREKAKQAKDVQEKAEKAKQDRAQRVQKAAHTAVETSKKITLNERERAVLQNHRASPSHLYVEEKDSIHKERMINWNSEHCTEVTKQSLIAEKKEAVKKEVATQVLEDLEAHPEKYKTGPELDKLVQGLVGKHLQTATGRAAPSTPKGHVQNTRRQEGQTRGG